MDDYSELVGQRPQMVSGERMDMSDLGGPAAERTTGLILTWRDRLVFGIEPNVQPLGARDIPQASAFVGIGGHLDPGEGWSEAVVREAMEEACCRISLGDSVVTYFCQQEQAPRPITLDWQEPCRPLLVWTATFPLRRGPNRERVPTTLVVAVFRAAALDEPRPGSELDTLLMIDRDTLLHTYAAPRRLCELTSRGARTIGRPRDPDDLLAPGGSAYFLAQWLAWQR